MLRVPIAYAKPGMVLAMPIFHPKRHDTVLLKAGMGLDERTVARLTELRIKEFWIRYPGMEELSEFVSPEVAEAHAEVTYKVAEAFETINASQHARLDYSDYRTAISSLLTRLAQNPKAALFVQEMADTGQPGLRHSSSVCMMALLMGLKLEDYLISQRTRVGVTNARDVTSLGLGAMLHDVGMLRLPADVLERWNRAQDESDPAWRQHVILGYDMVRDTAGPAASGIVLHHHQKFDGTGFPRRRRLDGGLESVAGNDIHVFARIVAAADLFDRLRHPPGADESQPGAPVVRVLKAMLSPPHRDWLDPMVFRALLAVVPAYAPGTIVRLSTGQQAVVMEWFPEDPCRPTVQLIGDPMKDFDRPQEPGERISLRETPVVTVAIADDQDVAADNFYPTRPGEFDLRLAGRSLYNRAAALEV
jgi:HD-GYP domain-containing protein (c-di-GMP phosphodiesterase class II)